MRLLSRNLIQDNMSLIILITWCVGLSLIRFAEAEHWYVSHNGRDVPCGYSKEVPCRDLSHVINVADEGDVVNLDGSVPDPDDVNITRLYSLCNESDEGILRKSVSLLGYNGRPRIGCAESVGHGTIADIGNSTSDECKVILRNVIIENGAISITNCVLEVTNATAIDVNIASNSPCNSLAVFINQTKWFGQIKEVNKSSSPPYTTRYSPESKIYCNVTDIMITDSQFFQNLFSINSRQESTVYVSGSIFSNVDNTFDRMGGLHVLNPSNTDVFIKDCVFEKQRELSRVSSLVNLHTAALWIRVDPRFPITESNASVVLENVKFQDNERGLTLIGIMERMEVKNCIFIGNTAKHAGAGVFVLTRVDYELTMKNCSFINNAGGTVRDNYRYTDPNTTVSYDGRIVTVDSSFVKGTLGLVGKGGAVRIQRGKVKISNCTFINNTARVSGGSIHVDGETKVTIENTYFESSPVGNLSDMGDILYSNSEKISVNNVTFIARKARRGHAVLHHRGLHWSFELGNAWVQCPPGFNLRIVNASSYGISSKGIRKTHLVDKLHYYCEPCMLNKYSIDFGYLNYTISCNRFAHFVLTFGPETIDPNHTEHFDHHKIQCQDCPYGGRCNDAISAAPNFWGFQFQNSTVVFQHCPTDYCCPTATCKKYNTCTEHRYGRLCGRCARGYSDAIFATGCVPNTKCSPEWFWPLVIGISSLYFLFVLFVQDLKAFVFSEPWGISFRFREMIRESYFKDSAVVLTELQENHENSDDRQMGIESMPTDAQRKPLSSSAYFIMLCFYVQDAFLLCVNNTEFRSSTKLLNILQSLMQAILTFRLNFPFAKDVCALAGTTPVSKVIVQVSIIPIVLCAFVLLYCILHIYVSRRRPDPLSNDIDKSERLCGLLVSGFVLAMLIFFQLLAISTFKLLKCVPVDSDNVLFIDGTVTCFQYWQYGVLAFALISVLPLCVVFVLGPSLMSKGFVQPWQFVFACVLPLPFVLWWLVQTIQSKGRLANVWIQLNRETKGVIDDLQGPFKEDSIICWLGILLSVRLALVLIHVFILDDIMQLTFMLLTCVVLLLAHSLVKPYKDNCNNFIGIVCALSLVVVASVNLVQTVFRAFDNKPTGPLVFLMELFYYTEKVLVIWLPFTIVIVVLLFFIVHLFVWSSQKLYTSFRKTDN